MYNVERPGVQALIADALVELEGKKVYRGQHGPLTASPLQYRLPSITFAGLDSALVYATDPNDRRDLVRASRVVEAQLSIRNPVPTDIVSPFIDAPVVLSIMGERAGLELLVKLSGYIEGTSNWHENFADDFGTVSGLVNRAPQRIQELYLDAYPVLDDVAFVEAAKKAGYDGAIGYGNGVTAGAYEYRVFFEGQVRVSRVLDETEARSLLGHRKGTCAA